jgi:hypothetical protein
MVATKNISRAIPQEKVARRPEVVHSCDKRSFGFPPATKAMLGPIWKSLLHQFDDSKGSQPL